MSHCCIICPHEMWEIPQNCAFSNCFRFHSDGSSAHKDCLELVAVTFRGFLCCVSSVLCFGIWFTFPGVCIHWMHYVWILHIVRSRQSNQNKAVFSSRPKAIVVKMRQMCFGGKTGGGTLRWDLQGVGDDLPTLGASTGFTWKIDFGKTKTWPNYHILIILPTKI